MARKNKIDKFDFSRMSERLTFNIMQPDGTFVEDITVWGHVSKDGFTRSENDNWFKVMIREQKALESLIAVGNKLKWKNKELSIFSWQDPFYEERGFIEILSKQIITSDGTVNGPADGDIFKDYVSVYRMTEVAITRYGLTSYEYKYDFTMPFTTGLRCSFATDRNIYLQDKKTDIEHDSLIVLFNIDAPLQIEDYIESPVHGRFKVDMIVKNDDNMLQAHVQRSEVQ